MDSKTITTNVVGGLVIAVVVAGTTWLVTRVDEGGDAIAKAERQKEIEDAIAKAFIITTPDGPQSVGTVLLRVDRKVAVIENTMGILLGEEDESPPTP